MTNERIYISKIQRRMFFLSFATAFIAAFTQTLAVLIDNVIVCVFYGEAEIASVALASPFFYLLEIPAAGLAAGIQTVCARDLGEGAVERANRLFNQIFFFTGFVMIILTGISLLFAPQMSVWFGARGNTAVLQPLAEQYLYGLSFEIVPYVLFCIMTPIVILDNGAKLISIASVLGCAVDIVLDLLSVHFGWGLFGIGMATSASAAVYFLITILHFTKREKVMQLYFVRLRLAEVKETLVTSVPKVVLNLADVARSLFLISLVSFTGGVVGTCVLSIHGTITYTIMVVTKGIAGAVGIMSGICWGEKNGEDLEGNIVLAHRYTIIASSCVIAALVAFARPLSTALTDSEATAELLRFAVYCICVTVPFSILVHSRVSYLQATERVREAQWLGTAANLIFLALTACVYSIAFSVKGVFMAFPTAQILTLVLSWLIHRRRSGKAFPSAKDYLDLDDSFQTGPGDVISYPLETIEDCTLASEQVVLFCRGHKIDARKGFLAGVCVEELSTNAIEHGLKDQKGLKSADIRVVIDGGDVIIRLRDSGSAFDLKRFADRLGDGGRVGDADGAVDNDSAADGDRAKDVDRLEDADRLEDDARLEAADRLEDDDRLGKGIGIRILLNSTKKISYYRTYGMNTTIIRV